MEAEPSLHSIRRNLFYGLLDYTKSFPDFSIPQRFMMVSAKEGRGLLEEIRTSLKNEKEILIYIHLPFCSSECVFCNAFPQKSSRDIQEQYFTSLLEEIDIYSSSHVFDEISVKCLYLGGGTPTSFSNDAIRRIVHKLKSVIRFSEKCNITCEAHTKDLLGNDRIDELAQLGIDRISIGCQTFDKNVLELCRRFHRESQVKEVIEKVKRLGLLTNIDMMIGLPGQTLEGVRKDLDTLSGMAPDSIEFMRHEIVNPLAISLYQSNPDLLVKTDDLFWMAYHTQEWMEKEGYEQNGRFVPVAYLPQQAEYLGLDGDVECGGRFVRNQQFRFEGKTHGDHGALLHTTAELVRIFFGPLLRGPQVDTGQ